MLKNYKVMARHILTSHVRELGIFSSSKEAMVWLEDYKSKERFWLEEFWIVSPPGRPVRISGPVVLWGSTCKK